MTEGERGAELRGVLLTILAVFLFTCMDTMAKGLAQRHDMLLVIWARYLSQAAAASLFLAPRLISTLKTRYPGLQFLRSAFLFGATCCYFLAISLMPFAEANAVFQVGPLMITLLAALVLRERLGPRRVAGVIVGFLGALIVIRPGAEAVTLTALLPLGAAVFYASYNVSTRFLGRDEGVWTTFLYTALIGAAGATLWLPWVWETPSAEDALIMASLGVVGGAGQLALIWGLTFAEASRLAPFSYVGIIYVGVLGYVFFGERPDLWTIIGAAVIAGAGVYVWRRERALAAR